MDEDALWDETLKFEHEVDQRAAELANESKETLSASLITILAGVAVLQSDLLKGDFSTEPLVRRQKYLEAQRALVADETAKTYANIADQVAVAGQDVMEASADKTLELFLQAERVSPSVHDISLVAKTGETSVKAPLLRLTVRSEVGAWQASAETMSLWRESATVDGLTFSEWLGKLERNTVDRINAALTKSMVEGHSIRQAAGFLRSSGVEGSRHGLEGLARTWMANASNYAREKQSEKALGNKLQGWRYSAILDGVTCLVCGTDHGKVFPKDGPRPSLPRHWRCRCMYRPMVAGWENGTESETYEVWLRRQLDEDPAFVRRVLGKARYELFRSGDLSLDGMVTAGRVKRLSEL